MILFRRSTAHARQKVTDAWQCGFDSSTVGPTVSLMVSQSKEMSISFVALVHQRPRRDLVAKWSRIAGQRMEGQTIEEDAQCLPSTNSQNCFV